MKIKSIYIKLIFTILFCFNLNAQHLSFDGTNDYVSTNSSLIDNLFSGTQSFTISTWVYGNGGGSGAYRNIISKGNTDNSGGNPKSFQIFNDRRKKRKILRSSLLNNPETPNLVPNSS